MNDDMSIAFSEGAWLNSCLVGANSYVICSAPDEFDKSFLEEDIPNLSLTGAEQHYLRITGRSGKNELWFVPIDIKNRDGLAAVIESIQRSCLGKDGFVFPIDLAFACNEDVFASPEDEAQEGYVVFPYDRARCYPVRKSLMVAEAPRWKLAVSLFERVKELHEMGLSLNGFSREQVRVDKNSLNIIICVNEYVSAIDELNAEHKPVGFLQIPALTERKVSENGGIISGKVRDLYSAAVLAFYLIHYAHPFVGKAFASILRGDYLSEYNRNPDYIFDPQGNNDPGKLQLGFEIRHQWETTIPQLKKLFDGIFMAISHPESLSWPPQHAAWLDTDAWIEALRLDALKNDNEISISHYPFESERLHQV